MKRVIGIFKTEDQAIRAIEGLKRDGYREDEISVVTKDRGQHERVAQVAGNISDARDSRIGRDGDTGSKTAGGAITGGTIGGIGGLLLGLGSFAIPGLGPIMAAGPIAAAIGGALAGGAVGGLLGALTDFGIPDEEAREYESRINAGEILVLVDTDDDRSDSVYSNFYENESMNRDRYEYHRPESDSIRGRGNMTGTGNLSDETGRMTDGEVMTGTDPRVTSAAININESGTTTTNEGINPFERDPNHPVDSMGKGLENETAPLDRDKLERDRLDREGSVYGSTSDTNVDRNVRASDTFDRDKDIHTSDRDRMNDPLRRDPMDATTHPLDRSHEHVDTEPKSGLMDRDRYNTDSVNTMDPTAMDEPGRAPTGMNDTTLQDTDRFDPESRDRRDVVDRDLVDTDRDVDTLENRDPLDRDMVDPDLTDPTRTRRR